MESIVLPHLCQISDLTTSPLPHYMLLQVTPNRHYLLVPTEASERFTSRDKSGGDILIYFLMPFSPFAHIPLVSIFFIHNLHRHQSSSESLPQPFKRPFRARHFRQGYHTGLGGGEVIRGEGREGEGSLGDAGDWSAGAVEVGGHGGGTRAGTLCWRRRRSMLGFSLACVVAAPSVTSITAFAFSMLGFSLAFVVAAPSVTSITAFALSLTPSLSLPFSPLLSLLRGEANFLVGITATIIVTALRSWSVAFHAQRQEILLTSIFPPPPLASLNPEPSKPRHTSPPLPAPSLV